MLRPSSSEASSLSAVLIPLLRGFIDRSREPARWQDLCDLQGQVRDQLRILGLELVLDEAQGYAYARSRLAAEDEPELPRLMPRRQLSYPVSLLLALLRRRLIEHDATSGERLILTRTQIAELVRTFLPDTQDESRYLRQLDRHLGAIVELGFLRPLAERTQEFEVGRIIAAFVDAQWLSDFANRLAGYRSHAESQEEPS